MFVLCFYFLHYERSGHDETLTLQPGVSHAPAGNNVQDNPNKLTKERV